MEEAAAPARAGYRLSHRARPGPEGGGEREQGEGRNMEAFRGRPQCSESRAVRRHRTAPANGSATTQGRGSNTTPGRRSYTIASGTPAPSAAASAERPPPTVPVMGREPTRQPRAHDGRRTSKTPRRSRRCRCRPDPSPRRRHPPFGSHPPVTTCPAEAPVTPQPQRPASRRSGPSNLGIR